MVALSVYSFDRGGVAALGLITAARLLPGAVAAPFAGLLLDRFPRQLVVAVACLLQAACVGAAAVVSATGAPLWMLGVAAALFAATASAARPGLEALLPALAQTPAELTNANAAWSAADSAGFLIGSGLGGVTLATLGASSLLAAATVACMLAAALVLSLGGPDDSSTIDQEATGTEAATTNSLLAGARTVIGSPLLRVPFCLFAGLLVLEGATDVQLVALAIGELHMGHGGPGLLYLVWGLGGLAAAAATLWVVRRRGYGLALSVGASAFGAGLLASGLGAVPLAVAAMVPVGIGFSLVETAVMAIVPRLADDQVVGRVYGVSELLYGAAGAVGALTAPPLIAAVGAGHSLIVVGVAYALCGLAAWRFCRRLDSNEERADRVRTLLHGVPFLTPLPLPQLERLVRSAREVDVADGQAVVQAGELGDEFYVIDSGQVLVERYDRLLGPGGSFGEIALLHEVPRTATIRAQADARLWAVSRPGFVAAVSGHRVARELAAEVVTEHLTRAQSQKPSERATTPGRTDAS